MTNYGIAIAYMNGILRRVLSPFPELVKKSQIKHGPTLYVITGWVLFLYPFSFTARASRRFMRNLSTISMKPFFI